ncbi:MAG: 30S ribosomal protein S3 [Anaerolineales bacterium]|nr:30S ribosomal protein S3 [Anaerolineales bacterium]MBS3752295.1 30S ribosomal protein S3 [Anaerolineales bacterium]
MGRKVHPIGFRLKVIRTWDARWYAEGDEYVDHLQEDLEIRNLIRDENPRAGVSRIEIERFPGKVRIIVHTSKPGVLIGRKGVNVKRTRSLLEELVGKNIDVDIQEIENPDLDAHLVAENVARQIESRISYSRAMNRAIQRSMREGAEGVRVEVSGRLGGAEMSRTVHMREGRVPRQTLRADIDYALVEAATMYGNIGVKVWIYRGEILPTLEDEEEAEKHGGVYVSK